MKNRKNTKHRRINWFITYMNVQNIDLFRKPSVLSSADKNLYQKLKKLAKFMRQNPTAAEQRLWSRLKNNQLGMKFRRQHIINRFIVDFCSIKYALVIEVDGSVHSNKREADQERSSILSGEGYTVIRFRNEEILHHIDSVMSRIIKFLKDKPIKD